MASAAAGSMTPAASSSVRTPPAPRLGFHDSWEPFSPRKSARLSSQRAAHRTPSPRASHRHPHEQQQLQQQQQQQQQLQQQQHQHQHQLRHQHQHQRQHQHQHPQQPQTASPRTAKKANTQSDAAMVSPVPSPRKKPHPALCSSSSRHASGTLTAEGTANAAAALGLDKAKTAHRASTTSISRATGMLPTPSKTPQKPPNAKTAANIQSFARNLFVAAADEDATSTPRKRRTKKYSGVTMESFTADESEEAIEIFTDSQDRVPVKDHSAENPFYGDVAVPEPSKRQSKRKLVSIPGERPLSVEEASRRQDGMVYVFRGKKFYRKFSENDDPQLDEQEASGADVEPELTRPLTRASVKPRLLFPRHKPDEADADEAVTDVEDNYMADEAPDPQTPKKAGSAPAKTPEAPRFAPVSPPATKRTTRSTNKLARAETPVKGSSGRRSPFDTWRRTKEHLASSAPKRHGESLAQAGTKRTRA